MNKFFTADYHFGHANIIKYCNRPFKSVNHMNDEIIKRHNARVKPGDMVFNIGDFCFRNSRGGKPGEGEQYRAEHYFKQLNGIFIPVGGNHDRNNSLKTIIKSIVVEYGRYKINLVHNPADASNHYKFNFVGHIHNAWKFKEFGQKSYLINVGVDVWNFYPVKFEEIMKAFVMWRNNHDTERQNKQQRETSDNGQLGTS